MKVSVSGVQLDITNLSCDHVSLIVQNVNENVQCTVEDTFEAMASNVAAQLKSAAEAKGAPVSMSILGSTVSSDDTSIKDKLVQSMKASCGNDDTAASAFSNVSVNMSNVTCDDLNILTQNSSLSTVCVLRGIQDAMNANPAVANAPVPATAGVGGGTSVMSVLGPDTPMFVMAGIGGLVLVAIVLIVMHEMRRRSLRVHRAHAFLADGHGKSGPAGKCDALRALGMPVPATCHGEAVDWGRVPTHKTNTS